jgi:hypothetical protein
MAARVGRIIVAAISPGERPDEWDSVDDEGDPEPVSGPESGLLLELVFDAGEPVLEAVLLCVPAVDVTPVVGNGELDWSVTDADKAVSVVPVVLSGIRPDESLLGISPATDVGLGVMVMTLN